MISSEGNHKIGPGYITESEYERIQHMRSRKRGRKDTRQYICDVCPNKCNC